MPVAEVAEKLPSLRQRPASNVVIYDGDCSICTRQVERLARWDTRGQLSFMSLHDPEVARLYPDLSHDELMQNMYLVDRGGQRLKGAAAIRALSRLLPRLWFLVPMLHIPGTLPLWQAMYQQVAKRRYRWGRTANCADGACQVHLR